MPKPLTIERTRGGHTGDGVRYILMASLGAAAFALLLLTAHALT